MATDDARASQLITMATSGQSLQAIEPWEFGWTFQFSGGSSVMTQTMWRVLSNGKIAITSRDHEQQFGLPEPVDAGRRATALLLGNINGANVEAGTADLSFSFGQSVTLEFLNTSCAYEGWHFRAVFNGQPGDEVVALGGGDLAIWSGG